MIKYFLTFLILVSAVFHSNGSKIVFFPGNIPIADKAAMPVEKSVILENLQGKWLFNQGDNNAPIILNIKRENNFYEIEANEGKWQLLIFRIKNDYIACVAEVKKPKLSIDGGAVYFFESQKEDVNKVQIISSFFIQGYAYYKICFDQQSENRLRVQYLLPTKLDQILIQPQNVEFAKNVDRIMVKVIDKVGERPREYYRPFVKANQKDLTSFITNNMDLLFSEQKQIILTKSETDQHGKQ